MSVKFQKRSVESMAVAEGASPTSAALSSGMWLFLRFRQGKKQPVCTLAEMRLSTRSEQR